MENVRVKDSIKDDGENLEHNYDQSDIKYYSFYQDRIRAFRMASVPLDSLVLGRPTV